MKDRFSDIAGGYATFRPTYPMDLYTFIFGHVGTFESAWDAGTGNGQVAADLAPHFKTIVATDISMQQLDQAVKKQNIYYSIAGEVTRLPDLSMDLITVAQAIHWFDRDKFYKEVRRIGRRNALLAVWGYGLMRGDRELDRLIDHFYTKTIGRYWDAERKLIDQRYATIVFPFTEITSPEFQIRVSWTPDDLIGYLNTWSSVRNFQRANRKNPVDDLIPDIHKLWPSGSREISFPVFMRLGQL